MNTETMENGQYSKWVFSVSIKAMALKVAQNDHVLTLFLTRIKLAIKKGSLLLINKFLLFQYSDGITVSRRAMALKVGQNDHVLKLFLTRIKLAMKSQGNLANKRMNIKTIENG